MVLFSFFASYFTVHVSEVEETITRQLMAFDLSMKDVKNNSAEIRPVRENGNQNEWSRG